MQQQTHRQQTTARGTYDGVVWPALTTCPPAAAAPGLATPAPTATPGGPDPSPTMVGPALPMTGWPPAPPPLRGDRKRVGAGAGAGEGGRRLKPTQPNHTTPHHTGQRGRLGSGETIGQHCLRAPTHRVGDGEGESGDDGDSGTGRSGRGDGACAAALPVAARCCLLVLLELAVGAALPWLVAAVAVLGKISI